MPLRIQRGGEGGSWWSSAGFGALLMSGLNLSQAEYDISTACSAGEDFSESDSWLSDLAEGSGPSNLCKMSLEDIWPVKRNLKAFRESLGASESCTWFVSQSADREESLRVRVEGSGTASEKCLSFLGDGLLHVREVENEPKDAFQEVNTLAEADFEEFSLKRSSSSNAVDWRVVAKGIAGRNGSLWCGGVKPVQIKDSCLEGHPVHCWKILRIAAFVQRRLDPTTDFQVECTKSEEGDIRVTFIVDNGEYETRLVLPPPPMDNASTDRCRQILRELSNFWRPEYDEEWKSLLAEPSAPASDSTELCDGDFREMGLRYTGEANPSSWGTTKCYLKDIPGLTDQCRVKVTQCRIPNYSLWTSDKDMSEVMVDEADKALAEDIRSIIPTSSNGSKSSDIHMALFDYRKVFVTISSPTEFPEWYLQRMLKAFVCYKRIWPTFTRVHIVPKMVNNKLTGTAFVDTDTSPDGFLLEIPSPLSRRWTSSEMETWRIIIVNNAGLPMADKGRWEDEWARTDLWPSHDRNDASLAMADKGRWEAEGAQTDFRPRKRDRIRIKLDSIPEDAL